MDSTSIASSIITAAFGCRKPTFRGSSADFARTIELGNGYKVPPGNLCRNCRSIGLQSCRHFEIDSARQLCGPFAALDDPNVRLIMIQKAVQTLGSLAWDLWIEYLLVHSAYTRIIVFLESDPKALTYCDSRLMDTLKANPMIAQYLPTGVDRFGNSKTDIKLTNGKYIRVCGLNESNAASLSWEVVIIDEAWIHGSDGLLQKAMDRAKQVADKKIVIVGQAGQEEEDVDVIWKRVKKIPVTWTCPFCGGKQKFSERGPSFERPKEFVALDPDKILPGSEEWNHLRPVERKAKPLPGSWAGLQIRKSFDEIKTPDEIMAACEDAYLECYHCGTQMTDNPALRNKLMESYDQSYRDGDYTLPGTEVGFWNPEIVSVTVPFRETMKEYVIAKKSQKERGNLMTLRIFYQSRWGIAWNPKLASQMRHRNQEVYDTELAKHDAWRLLMIVDNQKELMQQWVVVYAVQKNGSTRQLWRGALLGLHECRKKQLEYGLDKVGNPILKDQFVFLDGQYKPEEICQHIVENKYGHWGKFFGDSEWFCWNILQGSRYEAFVHEDENDKRLKFIVGDPTKRGFKMDGKYVEIDVFPFAATPCGERFEINRDGKGVDTLFLPRQDGEPEDENELSFNSQIYSNKLVESKSFEPRASKMKYIPVPASAPDHYFHIGRMTEAVKEIWKVDGIFAGQLSTTPAEVPKI